MIDFLPEKWSENIMKSSINRQKLKTKAKPWFLYQGFFNIISILLSQYF